MDARLALKREAESWEAARTAAREAVVRVVEARAAAARAAVVRLVRAAADHSLKTIRNGCAG